MDQDDAALSLNSDDSSSASDDSSDDASIPAALQPPVQATPQAPQFSATGFEIPSGSDDDDDEQSDWDQGQQLPAGSKRKHRTRPSSPPLNTAAWKPELVQEIERVLAATHATFCLKGDKAAKIPPKPIRRLTQLPSNCLSTHCRRLLQTGTLRRAAQPKANFHLKLGYARNTNLLSLLMYLTGDPAPEPCGNCNTPGRASYFGPECVFSAVHDIAVYVKHACACCYYSRGGCECDHAKRHKGMPPSSTRSEFRRDRVRLKRARRNNGESTTRGSATGKSAAGTSTVAQPVAQPASAAVFEDDFAMTIGRYAEIYGETDTDGLLNEQRELIARMEVLNRFLQVRFQQIQQMM